MPGNKTTAYCSLPRSSQKNPQAGHLFIQMRLVTDVYGKCAINYQFISE